MKQITDTLLMIEPSSFGFNLDASLTNSFQQALKEFTPSQVQDIALLEFRNAVNALREHGVEVVVMKDTPGSGTPDSIFPNNWFSTHIEGPLFTYPMAPMNRRKERREDIISFLNETYRYKEHIKLEDFELQNPPHFLEGTGSLVLDRQNRIAYAALSPRTMEQPLTGFYNRLQYSPLTFRAYGPTGELIYHTNVMMCVGETFAAVGLEIIDEQDRGKVIDALQDSGKEIIELSQQQVHHCFAGNMLQVQNQQGEKILVLSKTAFDSLTENQLNKLNMHNDHLLPIPIHMIEKCGGGSIRCMLAEIFKP
ncbi:citrulline utilization hydrolase CtlX [Nafulsella turpanensis]|uniref:citrulline utilization hydrolase CtlX n=1 Tax=Nafulsella turpanensis TaxID=1265690 RepID=UPI000478355C|nr:arginine deiminase-related protein [Nafulsella turpanensis]